MPGTISINMPMQPYLVKFLKKKYGESLKVRANGLIGLFLIDMLSKNYIPKKQKILASSYFTVHFPKTIIEKTGFEILPEKMKRFEEFIKKLFRSTLEDYIQISIDSDLVICTDKKLYKQDVLNAMRQFLKVYDISEDEVKLETLYRDYSRNKKNLGQRLEKAI